MKTKNGNFKKSAKKFITCYTCGKKSHKSTECLKNSNKRQRSNYKSYPNTDNTCRKPKDEINKTYDFTDQHSYSFKFDDNDFQLP